MSHQNKVFHLLLLVSLSVIGLSSGCNRQTSGARDQRRVDPVSQTPPQFQPLPPQVDAVARATPVPSQGDCAPKYANGLVGTCINNQACRGFGILDQSGRAACACFARAGGCNADERCDAVKKACVPDREPRFGRPRAK